MVNFIAHIHTLNSKKKTITNPSIVRVFSTGPDPLHFTLYYFRPLLSSQEPSTPPFPALPSISHIPNPPRVIPSPSSLTPSIPPYPVPPINQPQPKPSNQSNLETAHLLPPAPKSPTLGHITFQITPSLPFLTGGKVISSKRHERQKNNHVPLRTCLRPGWVGVRYQGRVREERRGRRNSIKGCMYFFLFPNPFGENEQPGLNTSLLFFFFSWGRGDWGFRRAC